MMIKRMALTLGLLSIGAMLGQAQAQTQTATTSTLTTEASHMDQLAASQGGAKVVDKISSDFNSFLGADSKAVVTGLRNGTPITLTTTAPGATPGAPPVTTTTTITPPTGKMGFGNVFISLALAKQQLSQAGITQPTPSQLQAALTGGSITTGTGATATTTNLQGILTMRSENMGWGQIAQKLGVKLGSVVSGLKAANHSMATQTATSSGSGAVSGGGQRASSSQGEVVSASGRSIATSGKGASGKSATGEGIVTGSGRSVGSTGGITTGRGQGSVVSGGRSNGNGSAGASHGRGNK